MLVKHILTKEVISLGIKINKLESLYASQERKYLIA